MTITTLSSRELNQDIGKAKKAARLGAVFITDRGRPAYVLLSIEEYQKMTSDKPNIVELLAMANDDEIDFDAPRLTTNLFQPADFS
jgi:prevent-host-death family protein